MGSPAPHRIFLNWDQPVVAAVADWLLPGKPEGPVDLHDLLVVVPTRQAGRRLREHLATRCAAWDTGLLAPRIVLPYFFFKPEQDTQRTLLRSAWAEWLMQADLDAYAGFFPHAVERDFSWALHHGDQIQTLREALVEGGLTLADVPLKAAEEIAPEQERWDSLVLLEKDFTAYLKQRGIADPCALRRKAAKTNPPPEGVRRLVLAAVPDPAPLALSALERMGKTLPVDILVHAPESMEKHFDHWGCPQPAAWAGQDIDLLQPEDNLLPVSGPADQARQVIRLMAREQKRWGPGDLAIGVLDREVIAPLQHELSGYGLQIFDPAERPLHEHALFHLLTDYLAWARHGRCEDLARLLRQPDLLRLLTRPDELSSGEVLAGWDLLHNTFLPVTREDLDRLFEGDVFKGPSRGDTFTSLGLALHRLYCLPVPGGECSVEKAVREFLQEIFRERMLRDHCPEDSEFVSAAQAIAALCDEFADPAMHFLNWDDALHLFQRRLEECAFPRERSESGIDLEGWLELHWNDAPLLMITGFNESFVPDSRVSDQFLPDRLRHRLALRSDAQRVARDAYLLSAMAASRREHGCLALILGKVNQAGDPLKPSRLLFACPDEALPTRSARLFAHQESLRPTAPYEISFRLNAHLPEADDVGDILAQPLAVTALRNYLTCPFRFYLAYVLGLSPDDDLKREPDAMDFGNWVHAALDALAQHPLLAACDDASTLADFLCGQVEDQVSKRFGPHPALPVRFVRQSAQQRLKALAEVQAGLVREGWEITGHERKCSMTVDGVQLKGRIDRVDRHRTTGQLRLIDYKTSDNGPAPGLEHLARYRGPEDDFARAEVNGKSYRWIDLQLPLYMLMLCETMKTGDAPPEAAYFNLPRAVTDTGLTTWLELDTSLAGQALSCAREILQRIRQRTFWPPAALDASYDSFTSLFPGPLEDFVDEQAFLAYCRDGGASL